MQVRLTEGACLQPHANCQIFDSLESSGCLLTLGSQYTKTSFWLLNLPTSWRRAGVRSALPPPVRIGSCRALVVLLPLAGALAGSRAAASSDAAPNSPRASMGRPHPSSSPIAAAAAAARLAPLLPSVYEGLIGLLSQSKEETLHLVLETLAAVIKCDAGGAVVQQVRSRGAAVDVIIS